MNKWKVMAIVELVLILSSLGFLLVGYYKFLVKENLTKDCYYVVCADFPQAEYSNDLCSCYNINQEGNFELAFTRLLK